jgi:ubiquinone/menaquinone biosynthesis C-methylase UbiE
MDTAPILDACCGGRMFWFDKSHPGVTYMDNRVTGPLETGKGRNMRMFECAPDVVADFKDIPYPDESFWHVVLDPPHLLRAGVGSYMGRKYGILAKGWQRELHDGFAECMRVLKPYGTLILKWSEHDIPVGEVIKAIGYGPLYGHRSGKKSKTHWMAFVKGVSRTAAQGRLEL